MPLLGLRLSLTTFNKIASGAGLLKFRDDAYLFCMGPVYKPHRTGSPDKHIFATSVWICQKKMHKFVLSFAD